MFGFIRKRLDGYIDKRARQAADQIVKDGSGYITEAPITQDGVRQKESNEQVLYRVYEEESWVRACVDTIVRSALSRGWEIVPVEGVENPSQANRKKVTDFLDNCNPDDTFDDLLSDAARDLLVLHNAYWEVVPNYSSEPKELWSLDAVYMNVRSDDHGKVTGFTQKVLTKGAVEFDRDQVLHWKMTSRGSNVYGSPRLLALVTSIEVDKYAQTYNRAFFKKGAKVRGAICIDNATPETVERNRAYLEKIAAKPEEAKGDLLLEGKMNYVKIGTEPKDMEFHQLRTFIRDEILAVFGCPPAKVALIETGNIGAGSGDSQDRTLYEETVIPLQKKLAHKVNRFIIKQALGVEDWQFQFVPRVINQKDQATVNQIYLQEGVLSVTEVRQQLGLPPRAGNPTPPAPEGEGGDDDDADDANSVKKKLDTVDPRLGVFATPSIDAQEEKFERAVASFYSRLAKKIVAEVELLAAEEASKTLTGIRVERRCVWKDFHGYSFQRHKFPVITKQLSDLEKVSGVIDAADFEGMLTGNMLEAAEQGANLANQRLRGQLPKGVGVALASGSKEKLRESVQVYSADLSNYLKKELNDQVKAELLEGITAGEGPKQLVKRVEAAMVNPAPIAVMQPIVNADGIHTRKLIRRKIKKATRAKIIARTETVRFMTEGALQAYEDSPVVAHVEFILAETACPECEPYDGKLFTIDEARGLIPIHHNCRCTFAPVVGEVPQELLTDIPPRPESVGITTKTAVDMAGKVIVEAKARDAVVKPVMKTLSKKHGAELHGLEYSKKGEGSMVRKFKTEAVENRWGPDDILRLNNNDSFRYTMVVEPDKYTTAVRGVMADMERQGFTPVKVKNYWGNKDYKGINSVYRDSAGKKFELQFHTNQSIAVKDPSHTLYEQQREMLKGSKEYNDVTKKIQSLWDPVAEPEGIRDVGTWIAKKT